MPDLAEVSREIRVKVASDVGRAKHAAGYARHPMDTLRVYVSRETWQDWLDREWWAATRARNYEALAPRPEWLDTLSALDAASLGSLEGAKLYGLALGSISDPSVPYGRAAVTCSWTCLVYNIGGGALLEKVQSHPLHDAVEVTSHRHRCTVETFGWARPSGDYVEVVRGLPSWQSGVLAPELSQLVCSWRPRGSS